MVRQEPGNAITAVSTEVRWQHGEIAPPGAVYQMSQWRSERMRPPLNARSSIAQIVIATMQEIGITLPETGATSTIDHGLST